MTTRSLAAAAAAAGTLLFTATAGAATLGLTAPPAGSGSTFCTTPDTVAQYASDTSTPYTVPAGGGQITQWQTLTAGDNPGTPITFSVLRPATGGGFTVVGTDTETLPSPLPASGIASFTLPAPIAVQEGDTLALYSSSSYTCYYSGGSTPVADALAGELPAAGGGGGPTAGEAFTTVLGPLPGYMLDVAATLVTHEDVGVTTSAISSPAQVGDATVLSSVVTNHGPLADPITFVDRVPSGLQILSAVAGLGTCSSSGQTVTCTITNLPAGESDPVDVVVRASGAGSYTNSVNASPAPPVTDPVSANDVATSALVVSAPASSTPSQSAGSQTVTPQVQVLRRCVVPQLRDTPLSVARRVLGDLGCRVRLVHRHSAVVRGRVIGVRGRTGRYGYHRLITLIVSSGKKPGSKHHTRKH